MNYLISQLHQLWQETAKDEVQPIRLPEGQGFRLLTQVAELKVFSMLLVNKRGKVYEYLSVLDPAQDGNPLIVNFKTKSGGMIVSLFDIECDINAGMEPMAACRLTLEQLLDSCKSNPGGMLMEILEARNGGHGSIRTVSGGLPTLGKRR
jgi:hypothetical protein